MVFILFDSRCEMGKDLSIQHKLKEQLQAMENKRYKDLLDRYYQESAQTRLDARTEADSEFIGHCDELVKKAKEVIATGQKGYDTFAAALSDLAALCAILVKMNPLGQALGGLKDYVADKILEKKGVDIRPGAIWDNSVVTQRLKASREELVLPKLQYSIDFSNDKLRLDAEKVRRSDGKEISPELKETINDSMKKGLTVWLESKGYKLKAGTENEFVSAADGRALTEQMFNDLRGNDKEMDKFFSERFGLEMKHEPTPSPRP